eukprot:SAG22_NODE_1196_length_5198_cov_3.167092_1_plen_126_part_00
MQGKFEDPQESLNLGLYGFMVFNMAGATGCLCSLAFPGRLVWIPPALREISQTMGALLLCLSLLSLTDRTGFWTDNDYAVSRMVLLGTGIGHLGIKNFYNHWIEFYIHVRRPAFSTPLIVFFFCT